jgi:hypothetical protein
MLHAMPLYPQRKVAQSREPAADELAIPAASEPVAADAEPAAADAEPVAEDATFELLAFFSTNSATNASSLYPSFSGKASWFVG